MTICVEGSVSDWIARIRRSEHMSAQACKRQHGAANGRPRLLAILGLATEGCWFESNRGSQENPPDLRKQDERGVSASGAGLHNSNHRFAPLLCQTTPLAWDESNPRRRVVDVRRAPGSVAGRVARIDGPLGLRCPVHQVAAH